jgi:hypothetical protein
LLRVFASIGAGHCWLTNHKLIKWLPALLFIFITVILLSEPKSILNLRI